jgi:hypothetical protein
LALAIQTLCERVLGTLRRKCLDFVIPLNDKHLYGILKEWIGHYNQGRPHMSMGPGIPWPPVSLPMPLRSPVHKVPDHLRVERRPILGGLHHEYRFEKQAS